ncbi:sialidase family protein [Mesorhizobium sp. CN2-181]|uniref:sialidase family protein n=1 Tax=Mesorhizobium yinganensis TaxID=3157707 RepID=UPI0032B8610D
MSPIPGLAMHHQVVHRDPYAYSAHPHLLAAAPDNWLLVFTQSRRRAGTVLHPPQDPLYGNMIVRSGDEGRTWSQPSIVPDFGWQGVECAGLTALSDGTILLNQWRFGWHTLAHAEAHMEPGTYDRPERLMGANAMAAELGDWTQEQATIAERFPWVRAGGETWVHRSVDGGRTFTASSRIDTAPFTGGYGMRGAVEVDGEIILPLSDVPHYQSVYVVRSRDGGESWSAPSLVASGDGHAFEEPAPLKLRSGRVVILLRDNVTRILHVVQSDDGGSTWSAPTPTGIPDYPADLVELADGRIACVAGRRRPPFGITLYLSEDGGTTWNADRPLSASSGLPNRDLGYPSVALRADGSLFVAYYCQDGDGVTGIEASMLAADWSYSRRQGGVDGQR